jgi:hypothetical protein
LFPLPKWWPCIHWTTWGSGSSRGALIGSKPQRSLRRRRLSCDFSCCFFLKVTVVLVCFFYLLDGIAVFHTEGAWSSRTLATLLFTCSFRSRVSTICDSCNSCKQPKKETVSIFWVILSGCFPSPGHLGLAVFTWHSRNLNDQIQGYLHAMLHLRGNPKEIGNVGVAGSPVCWDGDTSIIQHVSVAIYYIPFQFFPVSSHTLHIHYTSHHIPTPINRDSWSLGPCSFRVSCVFAACLQWPDRMPWKWANLEVTPEARWNPVENVACHCWQGTQNRFKREPHGYIIYGYMMLYDMCDLSLKENWSGQRLAWFTRGVWRWPGQASDVYTVQFNLVISRLDLLSRGDLRTRIDYMQYGNDI